MRVPSGNTTTRIAFVAVDAADLQTRKTGLTGFTVWRSRNGATPVQYTSPDVTELDATDMPGVYALLLDEDTTIDAGFDSQEMVVHITAAGMAPVTRSIELYLGSAQVADALLDRADAIEPGITLRRGLRGIVSALLGKCSGGGTPTIAYRNVADSKDVISASVDVNGNRSSVALDLG